MNLITVTGVAIRQDENGLYCLNDLHRAAGGEAKHRPAYWIENKQTSLLIAEMSKAGIPAIQSKQGLGTFVAKELVYAYAMWISAAFNLKVIRAYDSQVTQRLFAVPQTFAEALRLAADQSERREAAERQLVIQSPKVEFAVAVRNTDDTVDLNSMAKALGLGRNKLMAQMREDGVLMANNIPYQKYVDRGYFSVSETVIQRTAGPQPVFSTRVTGAGQVYLQRKYAPATAAA